MYTLDQLVFQVYHGRMEREVALLFTDISAEQLDRLVAEYIDDDVPF